MASLWGELRQRNVVKVAVSYAIVGWLLIEISSVLLPTFVEADLAIQLELLRNMERSGEFAPVHDLVVTQ